MRRKFCLPADCGVGSGGGARHPRQRGDQGRLYRSSKRRCLHRPCFANGQVGLVGNEAILAWRIKEGDWKGTSLNGLGVVAVVKAHATLGDPYHSPYPAESVLIVDQRATARQRLALQDFAASMAGKLLATWFALTPRLFN